MNKINDLTIKELIRDSYAALKTGDKAFAREYALVAAEKYPESEEAWLILASLSKPDQALRYLENALRANPDSQAARKGIRLIFSQTSAQNEKVVEKATRRLEDTAPIPVKQEQEEPVEEISIDTEDKAEEKQIIAPEKTAVMPKIRATTSKKKILRKKLTKKTAVASSVTYGKSTSAKTKLKTVKEKKQTQPTPEKIPSEKNTEQAEVVSQPLESLRAIEKDNQKIKTARKIRTKEKTAKPKTPTTELPSPPSKPQQISKPKPVDEHALSNIFTEPTPQKAEEISNQDSVWNLFSTRGGDKIPASSPTISSVKEEPKPEPKEKSKVEPKSKPKKVKKTNQSKKKKLKKANESKNVDVDVIEMVLVSIAAILLPLLAFLYFYLTK